MVSVMQSRLLFIIYKWRNIILGNIFGILIVRPFGMILMAIYEVVQSYGLAVILFALLCKVIMLPLSYRSKKSMLKMTSVQGEVQKLQKKYANNRAKLNEEMQALYASRGINPTGGCLTQFITLPIMMGLYYAVQQPLTYMMGLYEEDIAALANLVGVDMASSQYTVQITIAEALNKFVDATGNFTNEVLSLSSDIAAYLVPLDFNFLGLDLSQTPSFSNPDIIWIIPILSGATAFMSSQVMQKLQNNGASSANNQMASTMKTMLYIMPLMSVYFGFILPASIGIYWIVSNLFMMLQELFLTKLIRANEAKKAQLQESGKKNKKEGNE